MPSLTPPNFTTDVGRVRAMIPDIELLANAADPSVAPDYIFEDDHLQVFLDLNGGSIRLAAADACETLGSSEALIAKVITTEDLVTDGSKIMGQFLARARQLRQVAIDIGEVGVADDVDGFDIVPYYLPAHWWLRQPEGTSLVWP